MRGEEGVHRRTAHLVRCIAFKEKLTTFPMSRMLGSLLKLCGFPSFSDWKTIIWLLGQKKYISGVRVKLRPAKLSFKSNERKKNLYVRQVKLIVPMFAFRPPG